MTDKLTNVVCIPFDLNNSENVYLKYNIILKKTIKKWIYHGFEVHIVCNQILNILDRSVRIYYRDRLKNIYWEAIKKLKYLNSLNKYNLL